MVSGIKHRSSESSSVSSFYFFIYIFYIPHTRKIFVSLSSEIVIKMWKQRKINARNIRSRQALKWGAVAKIFLQCHKLNVYSYFPIIFLFIFACAVRLRVCSNAGFVPWLPKWKPHRGHKIVMQMRLIRGVKFWASWVPFSALQTADRKVSGR